MVEAREERWFAEILPGYQLQGKVGLAALTPTNEADARVGLSMILDVLAEHWHSSRALTVSKWDFVELLPYHLRSLSLQRFIFKESWVWSTHLLGRSLKMNSSKTIT